MARAAIRLAITPIHPHVGARVEGVDLAQPLDEPTLRTIFSAFQDYSVLVPWDAARHCRVMRRTIVAGEGPTADPPFARRAPVWEGIIPEVTG